MLRTCTQCQQTKELSEFYKHKSARLGHRSQCKSCVDAKNKLRYRTVLSVDPSFMERNRERGLQWYRQNKERSAIRTANNHRAQRLLCIQHYGPNCACCGEGRYEFLAIDHIDGGGTQHRKSDGAKIARWLVKNDFPTGFRVLCHNCNHSLGMYGFCPHVKKSSPETTAQFCQTPA